MDLDLIVIGASTAGIINATPKTSSRSPRSPSEAD